MGIANTTKSSSLAQSEAYQGARAVGRPLRWGCPPRCKASRRRLQENKKQTCMWKRHWTAPETHLGLTRGSDAGVADGVIDGAVALVRVLALLPRVHGSVDRVVVENPAQEDNSQQGECVAHEGRDWHLACGAGAGEDAQRGCVEAEEHGDAQNQVQERRPRDHAGGGENALVGLIHRRLLPTGAQGLAGVAEEGA